MSSHNPHKNWIAIAAMDENRVIGIDGKMPWHLPEDFKFFRNTTNGNALLIGRKTWDSIGRPLPGRKMLVISRKDIRLPDVHVFHSLEDVAKQFTSDDCIVYVAGGQETYTQALPYCSEVLLTHVKGSHPGDTFFPEFEKDFPRQQELKKTDEFRIVRYSRDQSDL